MIEILSRLQFSFSFLYFTDSYLNSTILSAVSAHTKERSPLIPTTLQESVTKQQMAAFFANNFFKPELWMFYAPF